MIITEFCKGRDVDSQAIRKYIIRHPEIFEGHTGKRGREITLDPIALDVLDKKYPLVQPVQVINGVDPKEYEKTLKELNQAKDMLRTVELENKRLEIALTNKNAELFLLEEKHDLEIQENERLKNALNVVEKAYEEQKADIPKQIKAAEDNLKNELQEEFNNQKSSMEQKHQEELLAEKTRKLTLWERLTGKKSV